MLRGDWQVGRGDMVVKKRDRSSCGAGDTLGLVCGRSCVHGRTWPSYNLGQKVKTRAWKEKDLAGSPGILVDTGGGALIQGPGLLLDTPCHLRSPQASCLFVLTMGSMFSAAPVVQICHDTTWFCNR